MADADLIVCIAPASVLQKTGSMYYNCKEVYSVLLMALVDTDYNFT